MIKLYDRIEIAHEFANAINSDEIIRMILFGSVARGDDNDESDIDILIVVHHDNKELESFIDNLVVDFILKKEEVISPHTKAIPVVTVVSAATRACGYFVKNSSKIASLIWSATLSG